MELFQRGLRNGGDTFNQQRRHLFGVLLEDERHFLPADRGFVLLPTIVVRGHRQGGIRDARFIGKRRFRGNGHVDDISPPHPKHTGFRLGGEAGAFDGDDGSGGMEREIVFAAAIDQNLAKSGVERFGHGRMDGLARLEIIVERHFPLFGEVDELIEDDEIAAPDFLPEGTGRRRREDVGASGIFEGLEVSPVLD